LQDAGSAEPDTGSAAMPNVLGSVTASNQPCDASEPATHLAATTCTRVTVSCAGVQPLDAELRTTAPVPGSTSRGTIVFGTGGGGTEWWDAKSTTAGGLLSDLAGAGFRVVQRRWVSDWEHGPANMTASSCRYATLLHWLHDNVHETGAFCAGGNSGGSTEIAYALAHWNAEAILDMAVPTGGPPMGRIDRGCIDFAIDPSWCNSLVPAGWGGQPSCGYTSIEMGWIDEAYGSTAPCAAHSESERALLLGDSVAAPDATYGYPRTKVDFIWGINDPSYAVASGLLFAQAVTSAKGLEYVPNTAHAVMDTAAGAHAIFEAATTDCVVRH
jgi:hypothetical protein